MEWLRKKSQFEYYRESDAFTDKIRCVTHLLFPVPNVHLFI